MKKLKIVSRIAILTVFLCFIASCFAVFVSCKKPAKQVSFYNTKTEKLEKLNFEDYIAGVVAAEIGPSAPAEALKAQAVLARTFALKFINQKQSKYDGADISSDISEAQAYSAEGVNDEIRQAVATTNGMCLYYDDELIDAYFHSNSGGQTATASEGLGIEDKPYLKSLKTSENSQNTKDYAFTYTFKKDEVLRALRDMGASVASLTSFKKGEVGPSGRCITFSVGGKEINANTFRLSIGSTKLKSTLIDKISLSDSSVTFSGRGYGHGVGLSQEEAISMASSGKTYSQILEFFFPNTSLKSY